MKKTSRFLAFCFLALLLTGCSSGGTDWGPVELARRDAATDTSVAGDPIAVAVSVDSPLGGLEMAFAVTGEDPKVTVSIYKAEKDYETTLSNNPQRKETFSHLTEKLMWQFRTLPAGDYLIVFSHVTDAALIRSIVPSDEANGKILHYRSGEIMTDGTCALTLLCIKTDENPEPGLVTFAYPVSEE